MLPFLVKYKKPYSIGQKSNQFYILPVELYSTIYRHWLFLFANFVAKEKY